MNKSYLTCAIAIALLLLWVNVQAQAPNLGTAADFVLFSTTGAVGNVGSSTMTGKVGTNNGAITGLGNVNGTVHNADGVSAQAGADLLIAYNQLNSAIPTLFPGVLLGNGDTLKAGVYQSPALTTVSGNLYLDALGDTNAVFIFQVQAALSTSVNTKIILLNGAQACRVFWKVEGVVSIADGTFFRGTIVANNAAINMTTGDTLEGRALSTTGAVNVEMVNVYTPLGCGVPVLTGPIAPDLASIQCFGVFSGNGSVTNAGTTYVTGDIGTNVGLVAGYNPLLVTGNIHPIPDVYTAAAAADLVNVYNYLNIQPYEIELMFPAQFGNELRLTPHTYLLNAATAFNGKLYLDALGNSDAVFLIKINGALSTGTFARMELLNGAQAKNIYWNVDGAVGLADFSFMYGNIIANNAAVDLTQGDTLYGRALTTNGALSTASSFIQAQDPCLAPLPVQWLYFRGTPVQNTVVLEWATMNEVNNDYFTIEKSIDGQIYSVLAQLSSKGMNNGSENAYTSTDLVPGANNYYRISQTDHDGNTKYYKTIQVNINSTPGFNVTHFVDENQINVQTTGTLAGNGFIQLYSIDGKLISSDQVILNAGSNSYNIELPQHKGIYLMNILVNNRSAYKGKIAVHKSK